MTQRAGLNQLLGWLLLTAGFGWAAWLDPRSISDWPPASAWTLAATRQGQVIVIGMGFMQLALAQILDAAPVPSPARRAVSWLTATGAVAYALGTALRLTWPPAAGLIPTGALVSMAGFTALAGMRWRRPGARDLRVLLTVIAFGLLLEGVTGLISLRLNPSLPSFLGPADGLRWRMLRLAQAAAFALPILALLDRGLAPGVDRRHGTARWSRIALLFGAVAMPAVLTVAALIHISFKYLLPIPADAIFLGTACAAGRAYHGARPMEFWGWFLIAASMLAGLLMGLFAFDGPLSPPAFLGAYSETSRRLARLGHVDSVLLGMLMIFVARPRGIHRGLGRLVALLVAVGSVTTLGVIALVGITGHGLPLLSLGPALTAAGTALCLGALVASAKVGAA